MTQPKIRELLAALSPFTETMMAQYTQDLPGNTVIKIEVLTEDGYNLYTALTQWRQLWNVIENLADKKGHHDSRTSDPVANHALRN